MLRVALSHSLTPAQDIIFILLIVAGLVTYFAPGVHVGIDVTAWHVAAIVLGGIVLLRLLMAPYWIHKADQQTILDLKEKLTHSESAVKIPLITLFSEAKNHGLDFTKEDRSILSFARALRQAGVDEVLQFWGRHHRHMFVSSNRGEPLLRIPTEHWEEFQIDWTLAVKTEAPDGKISAIATDNFYLCSYIPGGKKGYYDLHVDKGKSSRWLKDYAKTIVSKL